jgi:hypothetical protein
MASMNNAIPALPKEFDLKDAVDRTDRLLEVAQQVVTQVQRQIFPLIFEPNTGLSYRDSGVGHTPTPFSRPSWLTAANVTAYENLLTTGTISTLIAATDTEYGIYELAAALQYKFQQIAALNPHPTQSTVA